MNSIRTKYPYLQILLNERNPIAFCLQETKLQPNKQCKIFNYKVYRKDCPPTNNAKGGVLVAAHVSIKSEAVLLQTSFQAVATRIHSVRPITLCSIYLHHEDDINLADLKNLIQQLPSPFILSGDFNSHNTLWGSNNTNSRGKIIENLLSDPHICLLNTGKNTRFDCYTGRSTAIDLTLCSSTVLDELTWDIADNLYNSDHFPQIIGLKLTHTLSIPRFQNWNIKKANWNLFKTSLALPDINNLPHDVEEANTCITNAIIASAENSIPKFSPISNKKNVPWWNQDCSAAIKTKNRALNAAKKHPNQENLSQFKIARAKARRTVIESKRKCWQNFVSSINLKTSSTLMWKKIGNMANKKSFMPIVALKDNNGNLQNSLEKITEIMADHLHRVSSGVDPISEVEIEPSSTTIEDYNQPLKYLELKMAIKTMKSKTTGPDMIHIDMLRNLNRSQLDIILALLNRVWSDKKLPTPWLEAHIIPLLKPNKDPDDPSSYRPISLTNVLSKIMEKIVTKRLEWHLEQNNILDQHQNGFRKKRSTTDNLLHLQQEIIDGFTSNQNTLCVLFDVEKAFDRLSRNSILQTLKRWNIRGNLPLFVKAFLQHRKFQVRIGNTISTSRSLETGTPQGSVISPLLFIIGLTGIKDIIHRPVKYSMFADDLAIYIRGKNESLLESELQKVINNLNHWAFKIGLRFSESKTVAINFSQKNTAPSQINLRLNNKLLKSTDNAKFLGLLFDKKMTWKEHTNELKSRANKALNILKKLYNTKWGSNRYTMTRIYYSHIRPIIDYGSIVYATGRETTLSKLNSVQNNALRLCSGAFRTSPVDSLQVEMNILSLKHRRTELTLKYYAKIASSKNNINYYNTLHSPLRDQYNRYLPLGERSKKYLSALDLSLPNEVPDIPKDPPWSYRYYTTLAKSKPIKNFENAIKTRTLLIAQNEWNDKILNKLHHIKPTIENWSTSTRKNRREEVILARLRIGHTKITHAPLITEGKIPICDSCNSPLTIEHLLLHCKTYKASRLLHIKDKDISKLLRNEEEKIQNIFKFLKHTKLYDEI